MPANNDLISTEKRGHVLLIAINRPAKMNAFTRKMLHSLAEAYTRLEDDPVLRAGLLYAEGDHFTAGLDLADVGPHVASGGGIFPEGTVDPWQVAGRERSKPMVVVVQGNAYTLAIELILAADICIAAEDVRFGQIEVARGIMPFGGATVRFVQRCGWGHAMRYILTGDFFDAAESLRIGLVQELAEDKTAAFQKGLNIANRIAANAPLAVQASLKNARKALVEGEAAATAELMSLTRQLMQSKDAAEGLQSFVERREARFTGE